jgi:hypothetical protein
MMMTFGRRSRQRGTAIPALLISLTICGALSAGVLMTNTARTREASSDLAEERALHLAEAGADWGVAQIRIRNGVVPTVTTIGSAAKAGTFTVTYQQGNANGRDDDGNGIVDNPEESDYAVVKSTGNAQRMRRTIEVLMRRAIIIPTFTAAVQLNVEAPVLDLSGNAFVVDGREHAIDGTLDPLGATKYGISAPVADTTTLTSQIPSKNVDQVVGTGTDPSVGAVSAIDLNTLVEQAKAAATVIVAPGTHSDLALGSPVAGGTVVAYAPGDVHFSGTVGGAGVLVVDGDLTISGSFLWTGIVIVRGRVNMYGGGGLKRIIGALVVGEEATASTSSTEVDINGTVDLYYSSAAIQLAADSFAIMALMAWREVANP